MQPAKSAEQSHRERQDLYKKLLAENQWLYVAWGIVIGLLIAAVIGGNESIWDVLMSFAPEFVGLLFVTLVLDRRAEHRERERHKQQLIRDIRSGSNDFALRAVNELSHEGWLGMLQGADLGFANLQDATLSEANLQNANLIGANLQGAGLGGANLQDASLFGANLQKANLWGVKLQGADLKCANLQDATLSDVNVHGVELFHSELNEMTLLPDRTHYDPQQGPEQLERFTNSNHPDFWRSDWLYSPAYRGDLETAGDE